MAVVAMLLLVDVVISCVELPSQRKPGSPLCEDTQLAYLLNVTGVSMVAVMFMTLLVNIVVALNELRWEEDSAAHYGSRRAA